MILVRAKIPTGFSNFLTIFYSRRLVMLCVVSTDDSIGRHFDILIIFEIVSLFGEAVSFEAFIWSLISFGEVIGWAYS